MTLFGLNYKKRSSRKARISILVHITVAHQNVKVIAQVFFFTSLNEEINLFKKKGVTLVQRNINIITGNAKDFIKYDKFDQQLGIENLNNQHVRNSQG